MEKIQLCKLLLPDLVRQGVKNMAVVCPSFIADCLETLEEIAITNKAIFEQAGGKAYHYIAALNDREEHINCLVNIVSQHF